MSPKNTSEVSVLEENATHGEVAFSLLPHEEILVSFEMLVCKLRTMKKIDHFGSHVLRMVQVFDGGSFFEALGGEAAGKHTVVLHLGLVPAWPSPSR